jgi:hypothetical protein
MLRNDAPIPFVEPLAEFVSMLYPPASEGTLEPMMPMITTTDYPARAASAATVSTWQNVGARFELDHVLALAGRSAR